MPISWRLCAAIVNAVIVIGLAIALIITRGTLDRVKAEKATVIAEVRAKTAEAQAADLAHVRAVEAAQDKVREEVSRDLESKLAAARAAVDDYARRLRAQAAQGGGGATPVPIASEAARAPAGAGTEALVSDLQICAENTVKAEGWQAWWREAEQQH